MRKNTIHPTSCTCKICTRKNKKNKKEEKKVIRTFYTIIVGFFIILVI